MIFSLIMITRHTEIMPPKAPTTKRKKTTKTVKRRVIDPSALEQVDELLDLLSGQPRAQFVNAQQLSEASIKLGLTIDVDLAHSMLEFSTGHEDDVEITREQFIQTIKRLLDDAPE